MSLNKNIIYCRQGTILILLAVMIPVVLGVMGAAIDIGRLLAVQGKAQSASDAALLGAVSTVSTALDYQTAFRNQFVANFNMSAINSAGYMGSTAQ